MHASSGRQMLLIAVFVAALLALPFRGVTTTMADPAPCADLVVDGIAFNPALPRQGVPATVNVTVRNQGSCSTNIAFVVQWKQSEFSPTGPSVSVGPLASGASTVASLPYTFLQSGYFLTIVNVDTNNVVAETNEDNNLAVQIVQVEKATTDLIITDFFVTPIMNGTGADPVAQGFTAYAYITIENTGNTDAGAFLVNWSPTIFTPALSTNVAGGLAAGASTTVEITFNYPNVGTFFTIATVDPTWLVPETNEFNNTSFTQVQVLPALSDLTITNVVLNPAAPKTGENVHVTVTVENNGFVSTGQSFAVSWKAGQFGPTLSQQVPALAAGGSTNVEFDHTFSFPGTYNWIATADSNKVIKELDENNNNLAGSVDVVGSSPDLLITSVALVPTPPEQGDPTTINVTIMNQGNGDAGPFVVSFNPDGFFTLVPSPGTLTSQVNGLAAGASTVVPFTFTYPRAGNFHTVSQVDAFSSVFESNETNNQFIKDIVVIPDNVNLTITQFDLSPSPADRFSKVTATITVANTGLLPVSWFSVEWQAVAGNPFNPTKWIAGLNPGESIQFTLETYYFNSGTFTTIVTADPSNAIAETNEVDNVMMKSITINPISIP